MRATEFLIERASSILFHYTSIESALTIVKSGVFQLSSITGNKSEEQYAPPGHPFFLSLTRTSHGDYHNYVGTGAVLFKLNGDWFNSRYIVKPIDYWERAWNGSPGRSREAEDRVFSKDPTIPDGAITEIHLLMKEQEEYRSPRARELMIVSKQRGIPIFLYTDDKAWRLLDKRRAKNVADSGDVLRGSRKNMITYRKATDYIKPWIELLEKDREEQLSPRAVKLVHNLKYYGSYHQDEDDGLGNDLSNARKPAAADRESAVKLIKYMQLHHISTVQFKNQLTKKWVAIADAKNKKQEPPEVQPLAKQNEMNEDIEINTKYKI